MPQALVGATLKHPSALAECLCTMASQMPMLRLSRHSLKCIPVGRPLVDAQGAPTGPDPQGIDDPDADCPICAYPLSGPKEGENNRTIRFGAIVEGSHEGEPTDAGYSDINLLQGSSIAASTERFKYHIRANIASHFGLTLPPLRQAGVTDNTGVVTIEDIYGIKFEMNPSGSLRMSETFVLVAIYIENDEPRAQAIRRAIEEAHSLQANQFSADGSGVTGPPDFYAKIVFGRPARIEANALEGYDEHSEDRVIQQLESCGHQFHRECISTYAQTYRERNKHKVCPSCNVPMLAEEHNYLTITDFTVPKQINRMQTTLQRIAAQSTAAALLPETLATTQLVDTLSRMNFSAKTQLEDLQRSNATNLNKTPGNGGNLSWQQLSQRQHSSDTPPQRAVLLSEEQQAYIINWVLSKFDSLVQQIKNAFPRTSDGIYPSVNPPFSSPAGQLITRDLEATAMLDQARAEARRVWGPQTNLSAGIETRLTNDWNKRKTAILKTARKLRNSADSKEKAKLVEALQGMYLRKLRDRELKLPMLEDDYPLYDEIARSSQMEVLGESLVFCDYEHLNEDISIVRLTHQALRRWARTMISTHHSTQIDIVLRTHPLGDCNEELLKQILKVLSARDDHDFRRRYKRDKAYTEEAVVDVAKTLIERMPSSSGSAPCEDQKEQSLLEMLLDDDSSAAIAARSTQITSWLDFIEPDMIRMVKSSPWHKYWSNADIFNAVINAYVLKGDRGTPRYVAPAKFAPVWKALKDRISNLSSENKFS